MSNKPSALATLFLLIILDFAPPIQSGGGSSTSKDDSVNAADSSKSSSSSPETKELPPGFEGWSSSIRPDPPTANEVLQQQYGVIKSIRISDPGPSQDMSEILLQPLPESLAQIIDIKQNPCDDFEFFASGEGSYADTFHMMDRAEADASNLIMRIHAEEASTSSSKSSRPSPLLINIHNLYRSCMLRAENFETNKGRFFALMAELGSCPLLQIELGWDDQQAGDAHFRFAVTMVRLFRMGLMEKQLIGLEVKPDPDDTSRLLLHISQPEEQLLLVQTSPLFVYHKLRLLHLGINQLALSEDIDDVYKFAKILRDVRGSRSEKPVKMSLNEFARKYPGIDWKYLVQELIGKSDQPGGHEILVTNEEYLSLLAKLLKVTSEKTIPNYIFLSMFEKFGGFIERKLDEGTGQVNCLRLVQDEMALPVSIELKREIQKVPGWNRLINQVEHLIEVLRTQMEYKIAHSNWMSSDTKRLSFDKLNSMRFFIASINPDDRSKYDEQLARLEFGGYQLGVNTFIDNFLTIRNKIASFKLKELLNTTQNTGAIWSNLDYNPTLEIKLIDEANVVYIPIGLLQAPFFDVDQPAYMNYGSLGYLIARNIIKAFDVRGSKFNANGATENIWDSTSRQRYLNLANDYLRNSRRPIEDAMKTLTNDLVDLGASRLVYEGYESDCSNSADKRDSSSELSNGSILSPEQLLLVSLAANIAITHEDNEHYHDFPWHDRISQTLMQIQEFNELFSCDVGSVMNPPYLERTLIW